MVKNKSKSLPRFRNLPELIRFFDENDMSPYWEQLPEAHFDVDLKPSRLHTVKLEPQLDKQLSKIARSKKTSPERLIRRWVKEKIEYLLNRKSA